MAAAASNKITSTKDFKYPEIEEQALQFILDSCESSISKYNKFLQARKNFDTKFHLFSVHLYNSYGFEKLSYLVVSFK